MNGLFLISALATPANLERVQAEVMPRISRFLRVGYDASRIGEERNLPVQYRRESGEALTSQLFTFHGLHRLSSLSKLKRFTMKLEEESKNDGLRGFNLNPGFLDSHFLLMASHKDAPRRAELAQSLWIEPQLRWSRGELQAFPWTFEEFEARERRAYIEDAYFREVGITTAKDQMGITSGCCPTGYPSRVESARVGWDVVGES